MDRNGVTCDVDLRTGHPKRFFFLFLLGRKSRQNEKRKNASFREREREREREGKGFNKRRERTCPRLRPFLLLLREVSKPLASA